MDPSPAPVCKAVTLTAVGAACLENVEEGDALSFLYRRGEKFFLSEPASAFPDGAVYWDAMSVQTCRLEEGKKKYLKLCVQKVPVGPDGLPADFGTCAACCLVVVWWLTRLADSRFRDCILAGTTVAAGSLDLGQYATVPDGEERDVKVQLKPSGVLTVTVQMDDVVEGDGTHSADVSSSSQCVTPDFQSPRARERELGGEYVSSGSDASRDHAVSAGPDATCHPDQSASNGLQQAPHSPSVSNSMTVSSTSTVSYGVDTDGPISRRSLESKLRRTQRQCEEARARAFSEASLALQRGIEIDNLKRAKDALLRRLETAEQQLMTMMKQELAMTIQETDKSSATLLGVDAVIQQLASTKVSLAEKEFDLMEMSGQLKAKDAHIQALLVHLNAIKESSLLTARSSSAEVRREGSAMADTKPDGGVEETSGDLESDVSDGVDDPAGDEAKYSDSDDDDSGDVPLNLGAGLPGSCVREGQELGARHGRKSGALPATVSIHASSM